jgi:hypothetical protein
METEGSLRHPHELTIGPSTAAHQSSLTNGHFLSCFPTKFDMRLYATCPAHLILLDLIISMNVKKVHTQLRKFMHAWQQHDEIVYQFISSPSCEKIFSEDFHKKQIAKCARA